MLTPLNKSKKALICAQAYYRIIFFGSDIVVLESRPSFFNWTNLVFVCYGQLEIKYPHFKTT